MVPIRHNLGLLHANEGRLGSDEARYQDFSGYMGGAKASFMKFDYPVQCFNGANHWGLGWYNPNHAKEISASGSFSEIVYIGAFADRNKFGDVPNFQEYAVVKLGDYYIQYNAAWGINKDTNEAANRLTITQQWTDGTYAVGDIAPNGGETWSVADVDWSLQICSKAAGSNTYAEVLTVWVGTGTPNCGDDQNDEQGVNDDEPEEESVCKDNRERCTADSDCCSDNCRYTRAGLVCLPNPDTNTNKNQYRISRHPGRRTTHVRGSRFENDLSR